MTAKRKRAPGQAAARSPQLDQPAEQEPEIPATGREIVQDSAERTVEDEIGYLLAQLGAAGGQLWIHRRLESGKWAYCGTLGSVGFTAATVQRKFGGGTFRVEARRANSGLVSARRTIEVAAPLEQDSSDLGAVLREVMTELRTRQPAAAAMDPMQLAIQMQQVAATQMTTLVAMLEALRPKEAPAAAPALESQVSILRDLLELAPRLLRPARENGDSALDKYLPGIFDLLRGMRTPQPSPEAAPLPGPSPQPPIEGQPVNPIWAQLAPHVPRLIALAQSHSDVDLWADVIQEQAPAAVRAIIEMERDPDDLAGEFCTVFPAAAPHRDWFRRLLVSLIMPGPQETELSV